MLLLVLGSCGQCLRRLEQPSSLHRRRYQAARVDYWGDHRAPHYGSAGARCYISYNHGVGATTGYPEHDVAKVATVLGHADRKCHRRSETDAIPGALQQSLRNLATDLYNSGHGVPSLFLAAIKSGPHPAKGGLCIPVFGNRIGGGFSNFDRLRSKEVLIPESKAFVSYLNPHIS